MVTLASPRSGVQMVPLRDITADPALNPRAGGTPEDVAAEWAAVVDAGGEFPPCVAFRDRLGKLWLAEGFVRRRAYELAGKPYLPVDVREGDRRAAALWAAASNQRNGLRRTNADKRRAVEIVIRECPDWSDRRIAEQAGVGPDLAGSVRAELSVNDSVPVGPTRVGMDGRERALPARQGGDNFQPPAPAKPPTLGPYAPGPLPPPDPRDDYTADLVILCATLAGAVRECDRLAASPFAGSGGTDLAAARKAAHTALVAAWGRRPAADRPA